MSAYWQKDIDAKLAEHYPNPTEGERRLIEALGAALDSMETEGYDCTCYNYGGRAVLEALGYEFQPEPDVPYDGPVSSADLVSLAQMSLPPFANVLLTDIKDPTE